MKINLNDLKDDAQVQIIPLIDVIFCILTFFLLASLQFSRQQAIRGINLDLASGNSGTPIAENSAPGSPLKQQRFVLYIDALGQIFDITTPTQTPIPQEQLRAYLENYVKQNPTKPLVLSAARGVNYNYVIETLDVLRQVGGDRVSLAIKAGGADQSTTLPNQTIPNTVAPPINPQINPQVNPQVNPQGNFNPNLPSIQAPQIPLPGAALPGQGSQNVNPGIAPGSNTATQQPTPQKPN
jgi:biopolymer transport protein ExbD